MIPRRRYRRRMGFLSLVLRHLLLVGDNAAAHPQVAAVPTVTTTVTTTAAAAIPAAVSTGVPDIGQGPDAAAPGGPPLPPAHDLTLDSYTDGVSPRAIASDRHPHLPERSPPEPHPAKLDDVDGSRTRRRDHPPSTTKRFPLDHIFSEKSDGQQGLRMEEGEGGSLSTIKQFPPDHIFSENSDGQQGPRMVDGEGGGSLSTIKRFPPDHNSFPEFSDGQRGLLVAEEATALCSDGYSFFVTSPVVPDAEGCYVAAEGTSFGQGFVYVLRGGDDDRNVYPKLITTDGESEYFWAVAFVEGFLGGDIFVDCISKQMTSAAVHPAGATWQCDVDGTGGLIPVTDSDFSVDCGCTTTTTSTTTTTVSTSSVSTSSSTSGSEGGGGGGGSAVPSTAPAATPAPTGDDADRGLGTLSPQTAPPGEGGGGAVGTPTSPPTPAEGCYDDDSADGLDVTPSPSSEAERSTIASPAPSVLAEARVASGGGPAAKGPSTALIVSAGSCMLGVVLVFFSW